MFVYTVHGVIGKYRASNNKKYNAFGFLVHNFAFQGEYPGEFDKTVDRVDCKLKSEVFHAGTKERRFIFRSRRLNFPQNSQ